MLPAYTTLQMPLNNQPAPHQPLPGSTTSILPIASNIHQPAISNFQLNAWQHGMMQQITAAHAPVHSQHLALNPFQQLRQIIQKPRIETSYEPDHQMVERAVPEYSTQIINIVDTEKAMSKKKVYKTVQVPKVIYETHVIPFQVPRFRQVQRLVEVEHEEYDMVMGEGEREIRVPQRAMGPHGPRVERPQRQYLPPFQMPLPEPQPVDPGPPYRFYQWQSTDHIAGVAKLYECSARTILDLNHIHSPDQLFHRRVLKVPGDRPGFEMDAGMEFEPRPSGQGGSNPGSRIAKDLGNLGGGGRGDGSRTPTGAGPRPGMGTTQQEMFNAAKARPGGVFGEFGNLSQ